MAIELHGLDAVREGATESAREAERLKVLRLPKFFTIANRVSGQDNRAQGIVSAISNKYHPLGIQIPAVQALANALDYRDQTGTLDAEQIERLALTMFRTTGG